MMKAGEKEEANGNAKGRRLAARLKSRRRRKESLIKALFSRKFETPYVVSFGNELFFNGLLKAEVR
jgi:hypothetical protein